MNFRKIALICMLCSGLVAFTVPAMADGFHPRGKHFGFRGKMLERMIEDLDLDDAQQKAIDNIMDTYEPQIDDLRADIRTEAKNMFEVATADSLDENALRTAYSQFSKVGEDMMVLHARMVQEIKNQLTDDQKAELKEKLERIKTRMKRRGGFRCGDTAPDASAGD